MLLIITGSFTQLWPFWLVMSLVLGLFATLAVAVLLAYVAAWMQFKSAPREPMAWCPKKGHGHFRLGHVIPLPGTKTGMCPICYWEAISAPAKRLHNG
jgi:hypothetical protein